MKKSAKKKVKGKPTEFYQSQVSILGPVGYGPTTLPLRHSDGCDQVDYSIFNFSNLAYGIDCAQRHQCAAPVICIFGGIHSTR